MVAKIEEMRAKRNSATYTFERIFMRDSRGDATEKATTFAMQVKDFAFGLHLVHFSEIFENDKAGLSTIQTTFQVMLSDEFIFEKVSALFAFAASVKFRLCNQTFTPK